MLYYVYREHIIGKCYGLILREGSRILCPTPRPTASSLTLEGAQKSEL